MLLGKKIALFSIFAGLVSCANDKSMTEYSIKKEKVILVVSFGTTHEDTLEKTISECERLIDEAFEGYQVVRAFTSNIVRKRIFERDGVRVLDVAGALDMLHRAKVKEVVVQPLHIIPGEEYHEKVLKQALPFNGKFKSLKIGRPLLDSLEDYEAVIDALESVAGKAGGADALLMMGHGTHHAANSVYSQLQFMFWKDKPNVFIGTVEGFPELGDLIPYIKERNVKNIILFPFMLVAGDHAKNDLSGDEDSWKAELESMGFNVTSDLRGLGEFRGIRNIFIEKVSSMIE